MDKFPTFSTDLVELLTKQFPQRCPEPTESDREIWMYAGAAKLVASLAFRLKQESDNQGEE